MEDTITSAPHVPSDKTVQALRDQLNQDTQILASLDPTSATYQRLAARVQRRTADLLDYEDLRERQHQARQRALAEQHHRDSQFEARVGALVGILIGAAITYQGWGTWWLALGIPLVLCGLCGLFLGDV